MVKKVLLLGDSIMYGAKGLHGYGYYVQQAMKERATVFLPNENCQDCRYLWSFFADLIEDMDGGPDVVHWNNGLWDVLHFCGNPTAHVPLDIYLRTIDQIADKIRNRFPTAKVCFATTTPVHEHLQKTKSFRRNAEIREYNKRAVELLRKKGVLINDLYPVAAALDDSYTSGDGLHYTNEGAKLLSEAVTAFLESVLCDEVQNP